MALEPENDSSLRDINIARYNKDHATEKLKILYIDRRNTIEKLHEINKEIALLESVSALFDILPE